MDRVWTTDELASKLADSLPILSRAIVTSDIYCVPSADPPSVSTGLHALKCHDNNTISVLTCLEKNVIFRSPQYDRDVDLSFWVCVFQTVIDIQQA